jgi:ornithine cyclodeaminase/alanine dehydrogenase-like protein (mu-crystallin family)
MAQGTLATCNEVFKSDPTPRFYGAPGSLLTTSGSVEQTVKSMFRCQKLIREQDIAGEIGEVITGKKQGRRTDDEITLFDSTGIALQDSATVPLEYERALADGVGVEKKMIST